MSHTEYIGTKMDKKIRKTLKYIGTTATGWQTTLYSMVAFSITMFVMLWASAFLYATFYFTYLPQESISWPIHLQYKPCIDSPGICSLPTSSVQMVDPLLGSKLARGQKYRVVIDLEMPESEVNQRAGMFQVRMDMIGMDGNLFKSSTRSTMLRYKSSLLNVLSTFFFAPTLVYGINEQQQLITVELFPQYEDDPRSPLSEVYVEVQTRFIEVYSAKLRIHAQFSGLRYFMHHYPSLSATAGIGLIMSFLGTLVLFSWYRFKTPSELVLGEPAQMSPNDQNQKNIAKKEQKEEQNNDESNEDLIIEEINPNKEIPDLVKASTLSSKPTKNEDDELNEQSNTNEVIEDDSSEDSIEVSAEYEVLGQTKTDESEVIDEIAESAVRKRSCKPEIEASS